MSPAVSELTPDQISTIKVWRITALWGFSEAALGGVLHALKIPFSGIFMSGAAVVLISLLAFYSVKRDDIIKATITVILIKALVSPHSPINAYFSVFLQGLTGQLLFYSKNFFRIRALLLGFAAGLFSGLQKIIVLTIIFGNTLWESIDIFLNYAVKELTDGTSSDINFSFLLAGFYVLMHVSAGLFSGWIAGIIPAKVEKSNSQLKLNLSSADSELFVKKRKGKRKWWKRPSGIIIFLFSAVMILLSYFIPFIGQQTGTDIIIMIIRSLFIMFVWYTFLSPLILSLFNKYLSKKSTSYSSEISKMIGMFPRFRSILSYVWKNSSDKKGLSRIKELVINSFVFMLNYEEDIPADR